MPQDGPSVSATPYEATDAYQNLSRFPAVTHHNRRGFSQSFRGVVGTNSTVALHTSWPTNWTPNVSGLGVTSELTIMTSTNRVGTGTVVTHGERVASPRSDASRVSRIWGAASKLNRIQGIIRAPIDQILEMEVAFGDYHSGNTWKGNYASGGTYKITSPGASPAAMIKLTCNNPINPGPFNFTAMITLIPAPAPAPAPSNAPTSPTFVEQLKSEFWSGVRDMNNGNFPF